MSPRMLRSMIYRALRAGYHGVLGTQAYEKYWSKLAPAGVDREQKLQDPHREWSVSQLTRDIPSSCIEVGCGGGANLLHLARAPPGIALAGVDISTVSLGLAQATLAQADVHARFVHAPADNLSALYDTPADIVLTDAVLLYVADDKIRKVLREFRKVATRAVCALELHDAALSHSEKAKHTTDGWVRNYELLFHAAYPNAEVAALKIPPVAFPAGRWPALGHLITARFQDAITTLR